ncbi:transposase [Streptomyces sp. NPDC015032]|uniref:IS110 family transposase n=1 Tax=Streptomyces sp. NPDC015032 TaxID=3364937 RepID=UPI0036F4FFB2
MPARADECCPSPAQGDAGKAAHHCTVVDTDGAEVLSHRVPNNEPELLKLTGDVLALTAASSVTWAVDVLPSPLGGPCSWASKRLTAKAAGAPR